MSQTPDPQRAYLFLVQGTLLCFQHIEEGMRMYLSYAYWIIKKKTNGVLPFRRTYSDVKKDSMGTLLAKFKKVNKNTALQATIQRLTPERNRCAHKSLLMTADAWNDPGNLSAELRRLREVEEDARNCLADLMSELGKIEEIKKGL